VETKRKILLIGGIPVALALLCAVFFAGRGSGRAAAGADFASDLAALKGSIDQGIVTTGQLITDNQRASGYIQSLADSNGRIIDRLDGMAESMERGFIGLNDGIEKQRGYLDQLNNLDERASATTQRLGDDLESGIGYLDRVIERVQEGHD